MEGALPKGTLSAHHSTSASSSHGALHLLAPEIGFMAWETPVCLALSPTLDV